MKAVFPVAGQLARRFPSCFYSRTSTAVSCSVRYTKSCKKMPNSNSDEYFAVAFKVSQGQYGMIGDKERPFQYPINLTNSLTLYYFSAHTTVAFNLLSYFWFKRNDK